MAKQSAKKRNEVQETRREIAGVAWAALGIFLGVCVYFGAVGIIGEKITELLFGLTGLFAYALPVALVALGVALIVRAGEKPVRARGALIALGLLLTLGLLQVIARPLIGSAEYLPYIKETYALAKADHTGGGALGALLSYPLLYFTGTAGAYIFLIAGILIILLVVTSLSLKRAGKKAVETVKTGIQHANEARTARRQALYTEDLADPEPPKRRAEKPKQPPKPRQNTLPVDRPDVDFIPTKGHIARRGPAVEEFDLPEPDDFVATPGSSIRPPRYQPPRFTVEELVRAAEPPERKAPSHVAEEQFDEPLFAESPYEETPLVAPRPVVEPPAAPAQPTGRILQGNFGGKTGPLDPRPGIEVGEAKPAEFRAAPPIQQPYTAPALDLLDPPRGGRSGPEEDLEEKGRLLIETLESFHVSARLTDISVGPVITRYELQPAAGVRVNRITALADDIALALAARQVRIEAPIPGKAAVGIEIPNQNTAMVVLRDVLESREYQNAHYGITMALGKDIAGKVVVTDMGKMPHLLVAGTTGSGKSKAMNSIILSMVYRYAPDELQFIIIDPKQVEFTVYNKLPHMKAPVVNNPKKAAGALCGAVTEMTERYRKFAEAGARDLARYNELQGEHGKKLPKLVIVIDELADLMMVAPDTVEDSICRIAQLGRASGIHLIVATQRPSADVITGLIKANIPSRIALSVSSAMESRIILDATGAEKLLGNGDMLFLPNGAGKPTRVQGAFVGDEEIERVMEYFESQALAPTFDESIIEDIDSRGEGGSGAQGNGKQEDDLLGEAVRIVLDSGQASISMIQRRLRVGYARAARLVDIMEQHGYVSGFDGSKARKVLITRAQYDQIFGAAAAPSEGPIPAGTLGGTSALVDPEPEDAPPAEARSLADYADDDPDAPWARKPGERPPWEEVPFDEDE